MKEQFIVYGQEPSFEFNFDSIESKCLNTYWKNIDDPINYSIECLSLFDPFKACALSRIIGSCVEHGFYSPKLDFVPVFCKRITDLIICFIDDFCKAKGLTNDESICDVLRNCDGEELIKINPDGFRAIKGHYYMLQGVMTVVLRDNKKRKSLVDYYEKFERLNGLLGNFDYLIRALAICDDEKFLILNPETKEGWECTAGQIENNFSLMSLIQFCFHHERILEDMDIEYDYNKDVDLFAHNVFDLTNKEPSADRDIKLIGFYNYNAYQTDGKCNAFLDNRNTPDPRAWIYGEMSVGSIPMLDGYRIVLITKDPVISHTWDIHFMLPVHPVVKPEFKIVRKLEKSEVENWFGKIKTEIIS